VFEVLGAVERVVTDWGRDLGVQDYVIRHCQNPSVNLLSGGAGAPATGGWAVVGMNWGQPSSSVGVERRTDSAFVAAELQGKRCVPGADRGERLLTFSVSSNAPFVEARFRTIRQGVVRSPPRPTHLGHSGVALEYLVTGSSQPVDRVDDAQTAQVGGTVREPARWGNNVIHVGHPAHRWSTAIRGRSRSAQCCR